ncbi:MAG: glycosyltransferase family 9 protein [Candidatus Woesearchaeota archaeon]|jgi:ADP-heptose:LPS heptosyltransferase
MYLVKKYFVPMLATIDVLGNILFFWKKFVKTPKKFKKVLFIRLEHIGDMVMTTPCFKTWKKNYQNCEIHVLCKTLTAPLLKNNPYVDKIITYDASWFMKRETDKNKKFQDIVKDIKKEKYDLIFEMHGDPRNNYLASCTRAYSIGYGCRGGGFLLNKIVNYNSNKHMIKQNLSLIEPFCKKIFEKTNIYIDETAKKTALKIIKENKLEKDKFIIINPCSGRKEKNLTNDEVINFMKLNKNVKFVITGSMSDSFRNKIFDDHDVVNLTGKTDLLTLVELVRFAKKVYAPDTGIVHIAKAVGTQFECVYKTTDRIVWGY